MPTATLVPAKLRDINAFAKLWDINEVAEHVGISTRTVWGETVPRGTLRVVRVGRLTKYRPADVEAWIDSRTASVEQA